MAMQDVPHFAPPKFDPDRDDFRCFIFRVKEYCALYKLNVGMARRHILIQGLPDSAIKYLLNHFGSTEWFDQEKTNWATFDEFVKILDNYYYQTTSKTKESSNESEGAGEK